MKHTKKILSILLVAALLLTYASAALALEIDLGGTVTTGGLNDLNVRQAARDYMNTRAAYLLGETETMEWSVVGIVNDENVHKAKLFEASIVVTDLNYSIEYVGCGETEAVARINEQVTFIQSGVSQSASVDHELTLVRRGQHSAVVAADGYYEEFSNFMSCSYEEKGDAHSLNSTSDAGSNHCVVSVALREVNYVEEDPVNNTNDNKYGEYYNWNNVDWCAIFVRWCAEMANVSDTVVPFRPVCENLKTYYINRGEFYDSVAYGGTDTPEPGHIIFKGTLEDGCHHVGIVEKVEGNYVWIIDGNSIDENNKGTKVNHRSQKLTRSDILGYARPKYEKSDHTYGKYYDAGDMHEWGCINCANPIRGEEHEFFVAHNSYSHWQECSVCDGIHNVEAHVYMTLVDGKQRCMTCNYIKSSSGGITPIPGIMKIDDDLKRTQSI